MIQREKKRSLGNRIAINRLSRKKVTRISKSGEANHKRGKSLVEMNRLVPKRKE